jgi:hypothetical protein
MHVRLVILFVTAVIGAPVARADDLDRPDPPVRAVVAAAIRHAGLNGDPGRSMRRRARWAALAPWITVRASRDLGWTDDSSPVEVDHGEVLEVRATWRLDRLVFDSSETRAAGLDGSRLRARRELTREVIHLYFRRQRLRAEAAADPLELAEVTALLEELTGGRPPLGR